MPITKLADGRSVDEEKLPEGWRVRYGRVFLPGTTLLQIELEAFRQGWSTPPGQPAGAFGLGKVEHFKRLVILLWPRYEWTEWSQKMAEALCNNDLVAFMGCAGSGKSRFMALWALINWWAAPQDTAIAVTSTDIEGAKGRVWGEIVKAFRDAEWVNDAGMRGLPPGKITDQPPQVRLSEQTDKMRGAGQEAIRLVAAGNQSMNDALATLQGIHNKVVILILDELQDLGSAIIGAVLENLTQNPKFQLCAAGNIGDPNDPLGTLCRPDTVHGYDDVNSETEQWPITRAGIKGVCVRFDAEYSPNFIYYDQLGGQNKYAFLPNVEAVRLKKQMLADGLLEIGDYYRQTKAFITPRNVEDGRWSSMAITRFRADVRVPWATDGGYVVLGSADPAYTSGGDRFILTIANYGLSAEGIWTIDYESYVALQHDVADGELRNFALVRQAKRLCVERDRPITPENFGVDISGENPIGDIFASEWSNEILRVNFQGKSSARAVSLTDQRPGTDEYANKCTELWCRGAVFLKHQQLKGITQPHANELSSRKIRRGTGNKLIVESKKEMKRRTNFSPDIADGGNIILEVACERHGAIAGAEGVAARQNAWSGVAKKTTLTPIRSSWNVGIAGLRGRR